MTFEIYKLEWILSRHTFGNTTRNRNRLGKNMVLQVNNIYKTSLKACFCQINMPLFVR